MRGDFRIGTKEQPAIWRAVAKTVPNLPPRLLVSSDAFLHIDSAETYDFEFTSVTAGEIPFQFQNQPGKTILTSKMIVQ
jgi:hypothetical protein